MIIGQCLFNNSAFVFVFSPAKSNLTLPAPQSSGNQLSTIPEKYDIIKEKT